MQRFFTRNIQHKEMDRNTVIGLILIFALFLVWAQINSSSREELENQSQSDSLTLNKETQTLDDDVFEPSDDSSDSDVAMPDEQDSSAVRSIDNRAKKLYGPFAGSSKGNEELFILENEDFKVTFSTLGGNIKAVELKKYDQIIRDSLRNETKIPVVFHNDPKNKFGYSLPVIGALDGKVRTNELFFDAEIRPNSITFKLPSSEGGFFVQTYSIDDAGYNISYNIQFQSLETTLSRDAQSVELNWENYLNKIEVNSGFERTYSTVYFRPVEANPDYCSCRSDDFANAKGKNIQWFSHANQFFNSSLVGKSPFGPGEFETKMLDENEANLKFIRSKVEIPINLGSPSFAMDFYIGPNEFKNLRSYGVYLEDVIPFGSSIFGSINRWIIRPLFTWLSSWMVSAGLIIFMLTLIVKLILYPLTYKMLHSQSKMGALKPEMTQLKERYKDDQQQQQVETMKLYREFGVNPLGGCLPMVLQMPIWFALYRFFPAAIEFRQEGFWWATDLSSYDAFFWLPFNIPFYGEHVSMFTLLWAVTTVAYTYYNTKMMDMTGAMNPMMKYMQYFMPLMFIVFFNSFAAGLACYLFFSNVLNVSMIVITKNYLIDHDKIRKKMDEYRKKPKKKTGFGARLEAAMKESQRIQEQKKKEKK